MTASTERVDPSKAPLPPSSSPIPFVGSLPALRHGLLEAFVKGWRDLGEVVLYRVPRPMIVFGHPDDVQHFFEDHHEHHPRSWLVRERLKDIMAEGLFARDGDEYRRDLQLFVDVLARTRDTRLEPVAREETSALLRRWDGRDGASGPIDVHAEMQRLNLDITGRLLFGDDWAAAAEAMRPALTKVYDYLIPRVTGFPTPLEPLFPWHRKYRRAASAVDAFVYAAIAKRRREPTDDMLSLLLTADDARTLSDREARYQVMTLIFGFFKSIGNTLTWTWYLLSANPDARRKLQAELASVLGGKDHPGVADVSRLPYLARVLNEVVRLYPPLYIIARPPLEDEVVRGYRIPADMFCLFLPYITHRHDEFWDDPEAFDPDRFSPERSHGRHPFAYFPFAIGPRRCPGENFALVELAILVATIAQRHTLELVPGHEIKRRNAEFLLRPVNGLPMTLERVAPGSG